MPILVKEDTWLDESPDGSSVVQPSAMPHAHNYQDTSRLESLPVGGRQTTPSTSVLEAPKLTSNGLFNSDIIYQYVNFNLVRKMIPQNLIELLLICVIVIYLIYYFSQISRVSGRAQALAHSTNPLWTSKN